MSFRERNALPHVYSNLPYLSLSALYQTAPSVRCHTVYLRGPMRWRLHQLYPHCKWKPWLQQHVISNRLLLSTCLRFPDQPPFFSRYLRYVGRRSIGVSPPPPFHPSPWYVVQLPTTNGGGGILTGNAWAKWLNMRNAIIETLMSLEEIGMKNKTEVMVTVYVRYPYYTLKL